MKSSILRVLIVAFLFSLISSIVVVIIGLKLKRIEQEDVVGGHQIEPDAAGFQTDQKDVDTRIVREALDFGFAVSGLAVQIREA